MTYSRVRVAIIGGGPTGVAAAVAAAGSGASVVLIERGKRTGGMLQQSVQAGFGSERFGEVVSGPEYVYRDISVLEKTNVIVMLQTSVTNIVSVGNAFQLTVLNRYGAAIIESSTIVLAVGCRERTLSELGIYGNQPAGVFSAGSCQHFLNIKGQLPAHRSIMLGSSNINLAVAHGLVLAGAKVLGVYESGTSPVGYLDYVTDFLFENSIPIIFSHTVTRLFGSGRLRGVELARVDESGRAIRGSEKVVQCDGFIYSGGFVPNNELPVSLGIPISNMTLGPVCDQNFMTLVDGIFACGNCAYISDVADYVSESGRIAGHRAASHLERNRQLVAIECSNDFLTYYPQCVDYDVLYDDVIFYFDVSRKMYNARLRIVVDSNEIFIKEYEFLRPGQTQRIEADFSSLTPESKVSVSIKGSSAYGE